MSKLILASTLFVSTIWAAAYKGMPEEYFRLNGQKAKNYFFSYFAPKVNLENQKILAQRRFILSLKGKKNFSEHSYEYANLSYLQKKYNVEDIYNYKEFLLKIDVVPASLALAQAAVESGWGRSRFIKEANNIFGHWTYNPSIGMVPKRRDEGKKHLIRIFPTLETSIAAYMKNLNTTNVYKEFREKRAQMRLNQELISGYKLSETMTKYSAIGYAYVEILKSVILTNNLIQYDKSFKKYIKY
jgi:Bax protein